MASTSLHARMVVAIDSIVLGAVHEMRANPSVKPTRSWLRPPHAAYLKRWATKLRLGSDLLHTSFCRISIGVYAWET